MHEFREFLVTFVSGITKGDIIVFIITAVVLSLVALILKGFALWYSARAGQKWWFVVLLIINTAGILEIVYLIWYRPKTSCVESTVVPLSEESASEKS
jgi:hypothetical protein